ncbi:MAG: carbon-nitrogen hydrolase family protein [Acidimicrobiia bacterium]|nr:carbon-nitrogen hydrolase family protein [Acidimicrobiia bacterium]MDX2468025.1 carbon-nitrogen hydrolase family protein [Acidimicrobiia bacterium]
MGGVSVVRVAAVQAGSLAFDTPATLAKLEGLVTEAATGGAALVVFPEAFVGGYPKGHSFGAVVGSRTEDGRDWFRRYYESAIDVPGAESDRIGETAKEHGVTLSVGLIERDGGTLYCTVVFYGSDGSILGKHRKLMPTAAERLVWGFGDGSTMPVVDSPAGKLGAAICWENYLPLYRTTLYSKGVQVWCAPTVDDRERWSSTMQHIALEGRCFVVSANQYSRRADYPEDYDTGYGDDPTTVLIGGGSCIVDPHGTFLAGPMRDGETILYADIDLSEIVRGSYDLDVVGHYARPDVFQLHVNESRQLPVVMTDWDDKV